MFSANNVVFYAENLQSSKQTKFVDEKKVPIFMPISTKLKFEFWRIKIEILPIPKVYLIFKVFLSYTYL